MTRSANSATISLPPGAMELTGAPHRPFPVPPRTHPEPHPKAASPIEEAVHHAVQGMTEDLCCEGGIASIAAANHYSKFHFTREFNRITGTTPRRFLAALRMERAKKMLLETSLDVVDVSTAVGYMSVGTFSSRFSTLVGVSPREWRKLRGRTAAVPDVRGPGRTVLRGRVHLPDGVMSAPSDIFVAVYEDSVVQGTPIASTRAKGITDFELHGVPAGSWVVSIVLRSAAPDDVGLLRDRCHVTASDDPTTRQLPLHLRPVKPRGFDPPVIFGGAGSFSAPGGDGR